MERQRYVADQTIGDGLDGIRAYLIARGNVAMATSTLIVGLLLWEYYERAGKTGGIIAAVLLVIVTLLLYDLSNDYARSVAAIREGRPSDHNGTSANEQKKRHKKLIVLIVLNFFAVSGLGFVTGGIVNSPISPYLLAMTLLGQYLAVKGSTRALLGFYGMTLFVLMFVGACLLPSDVFIKPYSASDIKPTGAFLLTGLVNFGVGMHAHKIFEATRRSNQEGDQAGGVVQ